MTASHPERIRLTGTPIDRRVRLAEFGDEIDPLQREQLLAYGLTTSHPLTVLQQRPMTVVLCDHMELALEHCVAQHIWVEEEEAEQKPAPARPAFTEAPVTEPLSSSLPSA